MNMQNGLYLIIYGTHGIHIQITYSLRNLASFKTNKSKSGRGYVE